MSQMRTSTGSNRQVNITRGSGKWNGTGNVRLSLSFCIHRSSLPRHRSAEQGKYGLQTDWRGRTGYVNVGEKFSYDSVSARDSLSFLGLTKVGRVQRTEQLDQCHTGSYLAIGITPCSNLQSTRCSSRAVNIGSTVRGRCERGGWRPCNELHS